MRGNDTVTVEGFHTLNAGGWLNDEVLNFVGRGILDQVRDSAHVLSTFFFQCLVNNGEYNSANVPTWAHPGHANDILVPINRSNTHWLFLHVDRSTNTIAMYDSLGRNPINAPYLDHMLRYLYDRRCEQAELTPQSFATFAAGWTCVDRSDDCPTQGNGCYCGVFTRLSMAMIVQGIRLSKRTYSQATVTGRQLRRRLAHMIWVHNPSRGAGGIGTWTTATPTEEGTPTAVSAKGKPPPRKAAKTVGKHRVPSARSERAAKRKEFRKRAATKQLALGGIKVKRRVRSTDVVHTGSEKRRVTNRKRSAASVAAEAETALRQAGVKATPKGRRKGKRAKR